jgi:hypothetical protein
LMLKLVSTTIKLVTLKPSKNSNSNLKGQTSH